MAIHFIRADPFFYKPSPIFFDRFFEDDDESDLINILRHIVTNKQQQQQKPSNNNNTNNNNSVADSATAAAASSTNTPTDTTNATDAANTNNQSGVTTQVPTHSQLLSRPFSSFSRDFSPLMSTDLIEAENDYQIHVDLPGVDPADLDVSISDKVLVISAERKHIHESNSHKVHSMERSFGKVQRKVRIPNQADLENVQTTFKNGVLTVTFPKKALPTNTVRKLTIQTE